MKFVDDDDGEGLNDLERRNSRILPFSLNSIALQADYVAAVEDRPIVSAK